jgi:two-component system LytT family response regulator
VEAIRLHQPDLLFLDIQMPGLTGFEVLAQLERIPRVIFSTAYDQYALSAFEAGAVDYLLKPYDRARFRQAMERVLAQAAAPDAALQRLLQRLEETKMPPSATVAPTYPERLFVPQGTRLVAVPVQDIRWVEAAGDYATLHTKSGQQHLSNLGISQLAQRLDPEKFVRIHRSVLVALDAVRELERDGSGGFYATLEGGRTVRVSRGHADALRPLLG